MNKFIKLTTAVALLAASTLGARAEVINFNNLAGANMPGASQATPGVRTSFFNGATSHVGDYAFSSGAGGYQYSGSKMATIDSMFQDGVCVQGDSDYLVASQQLSIRRSDGRSFSLNHLDLQNYYEDNSDNPAVASFLVSATVAGGGKINTTLTLDNRTNWHTNGTPDAFNHFSLSGFSNITSVEISRQLDGRVWTEFALDNLNVSVSAVPEPSTWAMLSLGLAGLLLRRKQRDA